MELDAPQTPSQSSGSYLAAAAGSEWRRSVDAADVAVSFGQATPIKYPAGSCVGLRLAGQWPEVQQGQAMSQLRTGRPPAPPGTDQGKGETD